MIRSNYATPYRLTADCSVPPRSEVAGALLVAMRILKRWPNSTPTVAALQSAFGMSRATAYRWRKALVEAHHAETIKGTPQ